ncbi:UNVERIFIED_CONTAM: HNH endonuclease [Streptococcus canis]
MSEIWRPFPKFEDTYLISSYGNVYSIRSNRLLRQRKTKTGYLRVHPSVNGKCKEIPVHRAVAIAFIDNPDNKPTVNHINEDKLDNRVENLEWATNAEQNIHGTRIERVRANTNYKSRNIDYSVVASKHNYYEINKAQMKPVLQYDKHGIFIAKFNGVAVAARAIGVNASHICCCLKGRRKTCGGYQWKYG